MVVYTLEQRWKLGLRSTYRSCRFWQKKNHLFKWSSFWSWRVCQQAKLSYLGHRKADTTDTVWYGFWSRSKLGHFSLKMSKERPLQSIAIIIGPCWTNFCSQKLKRRILATFDFNWTALHATQSKLHSMLCALFLKIALSAAELMSFGHLGAAIWHCWTIICGVPSKISITPTSHRQLTL